eukprot:1147509-Pelagomonas_calceolata.AAC.1
MSPHRNQSPPPSDHKLSLCQSSLPCFPWRLLCLQTFESCPNTSRWSLTLPLPRPCGKSLCPWARVTKKNSDVTTFQGCDSSWEKT